MTQKTKGPASVGALPDRGSTNPEKDKEMNKTVLSSTAAQIPAPEVASAPIGKQPADDAVLAIAPPEYHAAWTRVRVVAKELSAALAAAGDVEFAHVRPAGMMCPVVFGNTPQEDPLLVAINAYKKGCADYRELPDDDPAAEEAAIQATYGEPMQVLTEWSSPAQSHEAVVAALELLKCEHFVAGKMGIALLDACIQFAKGEMI